MRKRMPWSYLFAGVALTSLAVATVQTQMIDTNERARSAVVNKTPVGASLGSQLTNTGEWREIIFTGHVLSATTGAGAILYAPSEEDDPGYRAAISAAAGGAVVDYFDARVGTPTVDLMQAYDCVYTWVNSAYLDNVLFGDNLAAYVDAGGSVVLGVFCTFTNGNSLSGLIMTPDYCPVVAPGGANLFTLGNYAGDGVTCLYDNVVALSCTFRDELVLQGSGIQDGSYTEDGEICHAYRPDGRVVYSNGSGASVLGCVGEWATAVANACTCLGSTSLIDCVCDSQYDVGNRVKLLVDNPADNEFLFAGDQGTVICGSDGSPPLLVLWDNFDGGHDGNGFCACPANGGGGGGGPITLPGSSGWYVFCEDVQLTDKSCPWDTNGDGVVGINDFLDLLAHWGACPLLR